MNKLCFLLLTLLLTGLINACAEIATGSAELTGLSLLHDRRTSDILVHDERIEINASFKLNAHEELRANCHFNITAYNGMVLATGEAPTEQLRNKIISIIRIIPGVKMVHNHIAIAQPSSIASRSNDALITSKLKTDLVKIRDIPGFDATRVKVITENKTVYLMGLLRRIEATQVTGRARRINGVVKVVTIFEYLD